MLKFQKKSLWILTNGHRIIEEQLMLLTWLAWQCMLAIAEYALTYLLLHKLWSMVGHMNIFWVEIVPFECSNSISLNGVKSSL